MIRQKDVGQVGQTISHYRILEKLGSGGMGVVYKAEDTRLKRTVALKFLSPDLTRDEEAKERFVHEAQAASALDHPNICTVYEVDETDDGQLFISMAYYEGETLKEKVASGPLPVNEVVDVAIQVCQGLAKAHSGGIVHRDIKPGNIVLTEDGVAKIVDFGLAKLTGVTRMTKTGSTIGTVAYMSPEQARGEEVDQRTDIWSLGVVLYEMLTGEMPFKSDYEQALVYAILNETPPPISSTETQVPAELAKIVQRCLEKESSERYQDVNELLAELYKLKGAPISIRLAWKLARRKLRTYALPAGGAVAVGLAMLVYFVFIQTPSPTEERVRIAVADVVNETGEDNLDGLSGLFVTAFEQSPRLSVLTRTGMFDALKRMGKESVAAIDEELGKEICRYTNANALLVVSVKKLGRRYIMDLKVLDPHKDEYLYAAAEEAVDQEHIYSMINALAVKARRAAFKEEDAQIQQTSQKVAEVTTPNLEAYQHYFKGEELVGKLKWKEAKEEFNQAIALDTTFALAYYRLSYAMGWTFEEGQEEPIRKAMEYIERVPEKERYLIRAQSASIEGNRDEAIAIHQELLKLYPEEKEALYEIGDHSVHQENYGTAVSYLEKLLAIDPTFQRALQHMTYAHRNMGQYDKMLEYAKRYVAEASSEDAYFELGQAYNLRGEFNEALQTYEQALELFPTSTMPVVERGKTFIFKDDYEKAEAEFRKLLQDPRPLSDARDGYRNLARLYAYVGKYRETVKMVDKMIEIDMELADNTNLAFGYAWKAFWLVVGRNDRQQAEMAIEKALELKHAASVVFYFSLFDAYRIMGEYKKASSIAKSQLPFLDVAVKAHVHQAKREYEEAIRDFQILIQRVGPVAKLVNGYNLAQCYFESGQSERAIEAIQTAQKIYLNEAARWRAALYPRGFYLLGKIYEKKGDQRLAIENYEKFLDLWKDADKDLPELIDAKSRLGKLKGVAVR